MKRGFCIWIAVLTLVFCGTFGMMSTPVANGTEHFRAEATESPSAINRPTNIFDLMRIELDELDLEEGIANVLKNNPNLTREEAEAYVMATLDEFRRMLDDSFAQWEKMMLESGVIVTETESGITATMDGTIATLTESDITVTATTDGITITTTTSDASGFDESRMIEDGFVAITGADGNYFYYKMTDEAYIIVDFNRNHSQITTSSDSKPEE